MKSFIAAITETFALFLSIGIVFIIIGFSKWSLPYSGFRKENPDTVITVASAMGVVDNGEEFIASDSQDAVPKIIVDFMNREISVFKANVISLYPIISFVSAIVCYIFGIGWPIAKFRKFSVWDLYDDKIHNYTQWYAKEENGYGHWETVDIGDVGGCITAILAFFLKLYVTFFWGIMLPIFIPMNIVWGTICLIFQLIGIALFGNAPSKKRRLGKGEKRKENYNIFVEYCHFVVGGDMHKKRRVYFNKYENAVIVQRILQCEEKGVEFAYEDAKATIQVINPELDLKYALKAFIQSLTTKLSKKKKRIRNSIYTDIRHKNYFCGTTICDNERKYIFKYKNNDNYILFDLKREINMNLMMAVMSCDANEEEFDVAQWNKWADANSQEKRSLYNGALVKIPYNDK